MQPFMILILGLGNPGKKYENTRHNIGFAAIDSIAANFQFPVFSFQSIFNAQISKGQISGKEIILAKPQTFMNESGEAVKSLYAKYPEGDASHPYGAGKIQDTIVIHDDIDLPLGEVRIVKNRGAAGHKGVESIVKILKTHDFVRIRLGIKNNELRIKNTEKFVLQKFTKEEQKITKEVIEKMPKIIETYLKEGLGKATSEYNR